MKRRLNMLLVICLVPLALISIYLMFLVERFSERYDVIVENITMANAYNIEFKQEIDYIMYIIVVNSERADELVDVNRPQEMIDEARAVFANLYELSDNDYARNQLNGILKSLDTLEDRIEEIEADAAVSGNYDLNMERLDLDIRVMTELIQEQIQEYIYYEATNLEEIREGIRADVERTIAMAVVVFVAILTGAVTISRRITTGITLPIEDLCAAARTAGSGDFTVRTNNESDDELLVLNDSFNQMVEKIGNLIEDVRIEQMNLRNTELKLLQAQINPHFLYNTLDAIIWLAEAGEKDQVVKMVTSLSTFFRMTLGRGKDFVSVEEEEKHIRSYLEIQQFRYRDILEFEIRIPEALYEYQILKLTLQPMVENALYHGIKNKRGTGHILVTGALQEGKLIFKVRDDGVGIEKDRLEQVRQLIEGEIKDLEGTSSGFGLFNVNQRIRLNYGQEYGILVDSVYQEWTEMTVILPAVKN